MKLRPILFSAPMVRAILAGTKTQTRRVMKPQPSHEFLKRGLVEAVPQWPQQDGVRFFMADGMSELVKSKHGAPGDRLWVRETFRKGDGEGPEFAYRADGWTLHSGEKWRPSIFMPRAASRITLEITGVCVERLNEISEEDAKAEGAHRKIWITSPLSAGAMGARGERGTHRDGYKEIWETINGDGSWGPVWVWAISFRRL